MFRKRIIIGGPPRSGSSLLRSILDAAPSIISVAETGFFLRNFKFRASRKKHSAARLNRVFCMDQICIEQHLSDAVTASDAYDRIMKEYMDLHGIHKDVWAEKSPRNCENYERLLSENENYYFLSIIRDGRDVVTSKMPDEDDYYCDIERYVFSMECVRDFQADRHLAVRYEDLVSATSETIKKIGVFLDEPINADAIVLLKSKSITRDPRLMRQPKLGEGISAKYVGRWQLPEHEQRISEFSQNSKATAVNQSFGYK